MIIFLEFILLSLHFETPSMPPFLLHWQIHTWAGLPGLPVQIFHFLFCTNATQYHFIIPENSATAEKKAISLPPDLAQTLALVM